MPNTEFETVNIAIAGLGTVGVGVAKIILQNGEMIAQRTGRMPVITAVSARTKDKDRGVDLSGMTWVDNATGLAALDNVDLVVELIGGSEGTALDLARDTLERGKGFVTANKALIAIHGAELAALAEANNAPLYFEAAVAGGIPILKAIREGLAGNNISTVQGILNGTCNYILTRMEKEGLPFNEVLADAQRLGYAEADPTFDVDGIDTAHKTAILAALAFGVKPDFNAIDCEGIRSIAPVDIDYAKELGFRIKLLGVAVKTQEGIEQHVHPAMVPLSEALAGVHMATNAVLVGGDYVGETVYIGAGAGEGPTASAVVGDISDILSGANRPAFGVPSDKLMALKSLPSQKHQGAYYIRLRVEDEPGVMADITTTMRDHDVSMESILQRGAADGGGVYIVMTTHETSNQIIDNTLQTIAAMDHVLDAPVLLRIETVK